MKAYHLITYLLAFGWACDEESYLTSINALNDPDFERPDDHLTVFNKLKYYLTEAVDNAYLARYDQTKLRDAMQDFFGIFRSICIICIVSSVIFNINLLYVDTLEKRKNHVIMRAIGLGKNNLYKSLLYQSVIVLILTLALSVGTFCLPIHFVMYMLFGVSNSISAGMMIVPILLALLLIVIIFMVPFNGIRKMYGYEELRELV